MEVGNLKFAWKIKSFSKIQAKSLYSDVFSLGPYKWKLCAYPKGHNVDSHMSIYLHVADLETLPSGWSLKTKYSLTVVNQTDDKSSHKADYEHEFVAKSSSWGHPSFISHTELHDSKKGYLMEDTCIIKADVTIYGDDYLESHVASKETKKEDDLAKNATEEDIDAFFGDLNSVIFPKKIISIQEEAQEALAIIEEALNTTPAENDNPSKMAQLRNAFDVLSSLDDLLVQKANLLYLKDNLIVLPERAANAGKNIKMFAEKELDKKTIDHKLGRCLIEFKKVKSETKISEQNIATLQELVESFLTHIGETKKKREDLLSKQKEMFKVSMELKAEMDVLLKNWPEYEEKMKAAQEEEKIVSMEWDKMKNLFSSLKTFYLDAQNKEKIVSYHDSVMETSCCVVCSSHKSF